MLLQRLLLLLLLVLLLQLLLLVATLVEVFRCCCYCCCCCLLLLHRLLVLRAVAPPLPQLLLQRGVALVGLSRLLSPLWAPLHPTRPPTYTPRRYWGRQATVGGKGGGVYGFPPRGASRDSQTPRPSRKDDKCMLGGGPRATGACIYRF